ncbi:hypothetical protein D3C80_1733640 [compost metagenome]
MIDPTDHIAQDTLRVIVQFTLNVFRRPVGTTGDRYGEDIAQLGALPTFQGLLNGGNIDFVIMGSVKCSSGG